MKRPQNSKTPIKEEINYDLEDKSTTKDTLKCELCSTVCSSISQLQSHTLSEHIPDRKPSLSSLTSSSNSTSSTIQRVACQQCEDTFENFAQFAIHMKSHIGSPNSQMFFCPVCPVGASFRDKMSQLEHLTTQHLQMQVTQFVCNECDAIFASSQSLSHHFSEAHRKLMCVSCDFIADNDKSFKDHSKVHCRQVTMYACALCASAHSSQQNLITHVQLAHDQETFYSPALPIPATPSPKPPTQKQRLLQCSVCDETVIGEDGLDEHRLQKHCKIRYADKCADCQESLHTETSFVEHCLRHSKDHAHHCPVCRQSLRSDAQIHAHCAYHMNYNNHQKLSDDSTSSTSSSPTNPVFSFVCPICGEKLEDGFALIEHSKQHL